MFLDWKNIGLHHVHSIILVAVCLFSFNKIHIRYEIIWGNGKTILYKGGLQVWLITVDVLNKQLRKFERRDTLARSIGRGSQITQRIET